MKKEIVNRILRYIKEEMMTGNAPGTQGGFSNNPPKKGVDGYDPVMKTRKKRVGVWSRSLRKDNGKS